MKIKRVLFAIIATAAFAANSNADVLVTWDVSGNSSPATLPTSSIVSGLTGGSVSRTGLGANTGANSFNSNGWNTTDTFSESNDYISFSLSVSQPGGITFTSLDYAMNGSNTAPGTGVWGYSVNGGAFTTTSFSLTFPQPTSLASWDFTDFAVAQGSTVEFRFWAYGVDPIGTGAASSSSGTIRIANITGSDMVVNGTVPEPTTFLLLGLGVVTAVALRRQRNAQS